MGEIFESDFGSTAAWSAELTPREAEVLLLVAGGLSAKQAAKELAIAPRTVERHIEHIRLKTRTKNRSHMVAHALRTGLIAS